LGGADLITEPVTADFVEAQARPGHWPGGRLVKRVPNGIDEPTANFPAVRRAMAESLCGRYIALGPTAINVDAAGHQWALCAGQHAVVRGLPRRATRFRQLPPFFVIGALKIN